MSENVKVNIKENDLTTPISAIVDSTDIAFIPGYSVNEDTEGFYSFTSLKEFTHVIGDTAKTLSDADANEVYGSLAAEACPDCGYIMASKLLAEGLPVLYCVLTDDFTMDDALTQVSDKGTYSVKYITSGGYPVAASDLMDVAEARGDCVALIDLPLSSESESIEDEITTFTASLGDNENGSYGAAVYPWGKYTFDKKEYILPASFGYLMCVAKAIRTSPNWLAIAGVTRGLVPNLTSLVTPNNEMLTNTIAENNQPKTKDDDGTGAVSVNCITNIRPYGLCIWGNRTLKPVEDNTVATNFLNIRNMLSDVKKVLYTTAKSLMFEQNNDTLWLRFKSGVSPLLNELKSGSGISDFKIIKNPSSVRGQVCATVRIYPVYAVEYFDLTVEISDQDVTVS